jgi:hypothetical protein
VTSDPAALPPPPTPTEPAGAKRLPRAVAIALCVVGAGVFAGYGLFGVGGEVRCTTEYAPGAPAATQGPAGLPPAKQTCAPVGLTDPPLVVLGVVFLVLAVPALGISQLGFAGVTVTRAAAGAADAAKSASQAADRAATAMIALANSASARSSAAAAGNTLAVYYTGDPRDTDFLSVETAAAFTLAANGVTEAVRSVAADVTAAVLLWHDPATDSLRSALRVRNRSGLETAAGVDMRSELGDITRKGLAGPVTISDPADARRLGLDQALSLPATAAAIPAALPGRAAVGLILAFVDTADLATEERVVERVMGVITDAAPFALPAAVLIERLTIAGERAIL